jgi:hypothetical protein
LVALAQHQQLLQEALAQALLLLMLLPLQLPCWRRRRLRAAAGK